MVTEICTKFTCSVFFVSKSIWNFTMHILIGDFLKMSVFTHSEPEISTSGAPKHTKLPTFTSIYYILKGFTEMFVHRSFHRFMEHLLLKNKAKQLI